MMRKECSSQRIMNLVQYLMPLFPKNKHLFQLFTTREPSYFQVFFNRISQDDVPFSAECIAEGDSMEKHVTERKLAKIL